MTDTKKINGWTSKISHYFTWQDWVIIIALAILAYITTTYGLSHILPGGSASGMVHGFLKLPGPGAGIFIGSAFSCIWLVLGILITKKPGTVLAVAVLVMIIGIAVSLAAAGLHSGSVNPADKSSPAAGGTVAERPAGAAASPVGDPAATQSANQRSPIRIDILPLLVALIIEGVGLLPLERKPWKFVFPTFLTVMGTITLALMLTGNAKMGENGAAATVFPLGYAVSGILALCLAVICFAYPTVKYIAGAGCAELFNIVFRWTTNGKNGLFTWVPVAPAIPALLTFAFVCGAVMAALAYGLYLLWDLYAKHGTRTA